MAAYSSSHIVWMVRYRQKCKIPIGPAIQRYTKVMNSSWQWWVLTKSGTSRKLC